MSKSTGLSLSERAQASKSKELFAVIFVRRFIRSGSDKKGFTLAEVLVAISLLSIFVAALTGLLFVSAQTMMLNRARVIATNLANQEIEKIRSLRFEDVGIQGELGDDPGETPYGTITPAEANRTEEVGRLGFNVRIGIVWVDDSSDGLAPDDAIPLDYRRVTVTVSWLGSVGARPVVMSTDITRKGAEMGSGLGRINVSVKDPDGNPVDDVTVNISGPTNVSGTIDGQGSFNVAPSTYNVPGTYYTVGVSKQEGGINYVDYNTGSTPTKSDVVVREYQPTDVSFNIFLPGELELIAQFCDKDGNLLGSFPNLDTDTVTFYLHGKKTDWCQCPSFSVNPGGAAEVRKTVTGLKPDTYPIKLNSECVWGFSAPVDPSTGKWFEVKIGSGEKKQVTLKFKRWALGFDNTLRIEWYVGDDSSPNTAPPQPWTPKPNRWLSPPGVTNWSANTFTGENVIVWFSAGCGSSGIFSVGVPAGDYTVAPTSSGETTTLVGEDAYYKYYKETSYGEGVRYLVKPGGTMSKVNASTKITVPYTTSDETTLRIFIVKTGESTWKEAKSGAGL